MRNMKVPQTATNLSYSVVTTRSVQGFLDYLAPSAEHWKAANRGDLAYRGQASHSWALVPKAFRAGQLPKGEGEVDPPSRRLTRVVPQAKAEFREVRKFIKAADAVGLRITEAGSHLLQEEPRSIFKDNYWEHRWPQAEILEVLALAQHYGVPTRLLDFTEDPLIAAYFAARSAWDADTGQTVSEMCQTRLTVWVIDLRFVRALDRVDGRYPERVGEVRVPRSNNPYLHAQSAFFLVDRGANDVMAQGKSLRIDEAITERADHWHTGNRLTGKGIQPDWFAENPVRQVRLHTRYTGELLRELESRGVTMASVMPSLDQVVKALRFQDSLRRLEA